MYAEDLKLRLRKFAGRIVKLVNAMPNTRASNAIANQIVRSGTSPFANYRAACRGKSEKDFANKLKMVIEELDETAGWLELIGDTGIIEQSKIQDLYDETLQLTKIMQSSLNTIRSRLNLT